MASHYIATYGASKFIVQMDTWDSLFVLILVLLLQSCLEEQDKLSKVIVGWMDSLKVSAMNIN